MRALALSLFVFFVSAGIASAIEPVIEIDAAPLPAIFKEATKSEPVKITTADELAKHFGKEAAAKVSEKVDLKEQFVLVFAWRGSGGDKMEVAIAESFPEQVSFRVRPGRTRDLRPHVKVYALRANVKWSAK